MTVDLTRRLVLGIAYDGRDFSGWAIQPGLRTVEGELRDWIGRVLGLDPAPTLTVAGRTDAGVHARGQVVHVDLPAMVPAHTSRQGEETDVVTVLRRRLARALPDDLQVRSIEVARAGFDARFSALWRRYVYRLADAATPPDPLLRHQRARVKEPLDVEALNRAGVSLLGLRDFAAVCKRREGATTIRTLLECHARRSDDGTIEVTVRADAFCHSMVRSLVGALTRVANGGRDLDWLAARMAAGVRSSEIPVMPAHGLVLEEVGYPPDEELAARAAVSRTHRRPDELKQENPA